MKCIILAAGYSTRLHPLTEHKPKQLLEIGGKFMIEHILDKVYEVKDIDEVLIVVNNKFYSQFADWMDSYSGKGCAKLKLTLINDGTNTKEERLGAVGDMAFAIENQNINDNVLIIGSDNLFECNLNNQVKIFKETGAPVVAARDLGDPAKLARKFGVVMVDSSSKIINFEEKPEQPKSSLASTCIYLYTKDDIKELRKCIEENNKPDNTGDFVKYLMAKKDVYCYRFNELWYDIGSHEELKEANRIYGRKSMCNSQARGRCSK